MKNFILPALVFCLVLTGCKKNKEEEKEDDCSGVNASYAADIQPIMNINCTSSGCHNAGSLNGDFTGYSGVKAKADNGSMNNRVVVQKNMPPTGPLSQDAIKKINCWLKSGSPKN